MKKSNGQLVVVRGVQSRRCDDVVDLAEEREVRSKPGGKTGRTLEKECVLELEFFRLCGGAHSAARGDFPRGVLCID